MKFEPGDLGRLVIDTPVKTAGAYQEYKRAVRLMLAGKRKESQGIANKWFRKPNDVSGQPVLRLIGRAMPPET
jgi:hypothetical protein